METDPFVSIVMLDSETLYLLVSLIFIAGFIDSIAGGGGLVTIPALTLAFGELSIQTIGTNKIIGVTAAGFAFLIYLRKGFFNLKNGLYFSFMVGMGAFVGSLVAPYVPKGYFNIFLLVSAPLILWIVFKRGLWIQEVREVPILKKKLFLVLISGILCGFYDGLWGPGGGTFMLLSLLVFSRIPLLQAMAISKFSNLLSASASLIGYTIQGAVLWKWFGVLFVPAMLGAVLGAQMASHKAEKVVRPILVIVVFLLMVKIGVDQGYWKFGGVCVNLQELKGPVIPQHYEQTWEREYLDLTELARLRWAYRWKLERLAEHFGVSRTAIKERLRAIKDNPERVSVQVPKKVIRGR